MKKIVLILGILASCQTFFGQGIVQFRVNKINCLYNFLKTAASEQMTSASLKQIIDDSLTGNKSFQKIIDEFKVNKVSSYYKWKEIPADRKPFHYTSELVAMAAIKCTDLDDFKNRILNVIPAENIQALCSLLKGVEPYYDKLIWQKSEVKINNQLHMLEEKSRSATPAFQILKEFYNSSWPENVPFIVSLYPVPGKHGDVASNPFGNALSIGLLTDETDYDNMLGVMFCEINHSLYDGQAAAFQHQMDNYFQSNSSIYKQYAYDFFDEALDKATAMGWAYKYLTGSLLTDNWVDDKYINGYAKALFPLVDSYISKRRRIDRDFVDSAINVFASVFPNAHLDYDVLMFRLSVYSDSKNDTEADKFMNSIGEYFRLGFINSSNPIKSASSISSIKESKQTQLILITENYQQNISTLQTIFPQIQGYLKGTSNESYSLTFFDKKNRPVIILYSKSASNVTSLLARMQKEKYIDLKHPFKAL